jgi:hypothetical protein
MRNQPPEECYEHANVEAADSLRQETDETLRTMARNLQQAADVLPRCTKRKRNGSPSDRETLADASQQAVKAQGQGKATLGKAFIAR